MEAPRADLERASGTAEAPPVHSARRPVALCVPSSCGPGSPRGEGQQRRLIRWRSLAALENGSGGCSSYLGDGQGATEAFSSRFSTLCFLRCASLPVFFPASSFHPHWVKLSTPPFTPRRSAIRFPPVGAARFPSGSLASPLSSPSIQPLPLSPLNAQSLFRPRPSSRRVLFNQSRVSSPTSRPRCLIWR